MPRDGPTPRRPCLPLSEAKDIIAEGNSIEASEASIEANRLSHRSDPAAP